jgi:hypothetical protein
VARIRGGKRKRRQARIGAPDAALTASAGRAAVTELCDRLGVIEALDAAVGPVKQRNRGFGAGELLTGIAAGQLAGEDFLAGLDRQRADAARQQITPVPGLSSTTAAGPADQCRPVAGCGGRLQLHPDEPGRVVTGQGRRGRALVFTADHLHHAHYPAVGMRPCACRSHGVRASSGGY